MINCKDEVDLPSTMCQILMSLPSESVETMINLIETGDKILELSSDAVLQKNEKIYPG